MYRHWAYISSQEPGAERLASADSTHCTSGIAAVRVPEPTQQPAPHRWNEGLAGIEEDPDRAHARSEPC